MFQKQGLEELCYGYIACMAVEPSHRRRGVASALLKAAEIQARAFLVPFASSLGCLLGNDCEIQSSLRGSIPSWVQLEIASV